MKTPPSPIFAGPRLVVLHIPKTAGTTFRYILRREFSPGQVFEAYSEPGFQPISGFGALDPDRREAIRVVMGHFSFAEVAQIFSGAQHVAFIRTPVARILSLYNHLVTLNQSWKQRSLSLEAFLTAERVIETDNDQTRRIAGVNPPFGACTPATLDAAIENIEKSFAVVGLSERFDESLMVTKEILGFSQEPVYARENVSRHAIGIGDIDEALVQLIRQRNQLDIKLYQFAQKRLDEQIRRLGPGFSQRVQRFREANQQTHLRAAVVWKSADDT